MAFVLPVGRGKNGHCSPKPAEYAAGALACWSFRRSGVRSARPQREKMLATFAHGSEWGNM